MATSRTVQDLGVVHLGEAVEIEKRAIVSEAPAFNKTHNANNPIAATSAARAARASGMRTTPVWVVPMILIVLFVLVVVAL